MAITVFAAFDQLKQDLEITGLQKSTVSTRQQNVREALEKELSVLESFLIGSYARSTMIAPLTEADIDVFAVLDSRYFSQNGQSNLLETVKRVLRVTYPNTPDINKNGQAVTVTFTDFKVDVVPAFRRNGGGYLIPNTRYPEWISTDPTVHERILTAENQAHSGDLVPMIKMIKGWNKVAGKPFVSFYLELLAVDIFKGVTISNYWSGIRYFFEKGIEKIRYKMADPAPYSGQVNGLNGIATVEDAVKYFQNCLRISQYAEQCGNQGDMRTATNYWKSIFGSYFPDY